MREVLEFANRSDVAVTGKLVLGVINVKPAVTYIEAICNKLALPLGPLARKHANIENIVGAKRRRLARRPRLRVRSIGATWH